MTISSTPMTTALFCASQTFQPSSSRLGLLAAHEVEEHRAADREARHDDEERHDDRVLLPREAGLRERRRAPDRQDQVLRVEGREHEARTERLDRRERVDRRHPTRHWCLCARRRSVAQLPEPEDDEHETEDQLQPPARVGRIAVGRDVARVGDEQHDDHHRGDADDPPEEEGRAVDAGTRREQHQDDRDDRYRTDRDTDRERENLSGDISHEVNTPVSSG